MSHIAYLFALIGALICLTLVDRRWKVAWFKAARRTQRTIIGGVLFFVMWDIAGIALHIFYTGSTQYLSGIFLGLHFPIEEILFLILLMYTTLLSYQLIGRNR